MLSPGSPGCIVRAHRHPWAAKGVDLHVAAVSRQHPEPRSRRPAPPSAPIGPASVHRVQERTSCSGARWTTDGQDESSRAGAGRQRRQAAVAVDGGPGQGGGAVRWLLPARRHRSVQHDQCGVPPDLRVDPVQVPLAEQAHHHRMADESSARRGRHPGSGAAAVGPAVVHRQRRRGLSILEPAVRRRSGLCDRFRLESHLPYRPVAGHRGSHRQRCRRHDGRNTGVARAGIPSRGDSDRRRHHHHRLPAQARRSARGAGRSVGGVCVDGDLRLHHAGADPGVADRRRRRELRARHGSQRHPVFRESAHGEPVRLREERRARCHRPRPSLLARHQHP